MRAAQTASRVAAGASALDRKLERRHDSIDQHLRRVESDLGVIPVPRRAAPGLPPSGPQAAAGPVAVSKASLRQVHTSALTVKSVDEKLELDTKLANARMHIIELATQKVAVTVRRLGDEFGGELIDVRGALPTFLATVNATLGGGDRIVALREATHMARVHDTASLVSGMLLYATTEQQERSQFSSSW